MKAFAVSAIFFVAVVVATGFAYQRLGNVTASETFATESVRLDVEDTVRGRPEFAPGG